jgi:hypothetical protein
MDRKEWRKSGWDGMVLKGLLTIRRSLYGTQISENNIPDQPHQSLEPQLEENDKIINFLKQSCLYKLILEN